MTVCQKMSVTHACSVNTTDLFTFFVLWFLTVYVHKTVSYSVHNRDISERWVPLFKEGGAVYLLSLICLNEASLVLKPVCLLI